MSNLEDRKRSVQEEEFLAMGARETQRFELQKKRRNGQGEFLGDMIGGVGSFAGSKTGSLLVTGARVFCIVTVGLWFAYMLGTVT